MGHVIAISGKGGVGKTTLCGLLIQYLCESGNPYGRLHPGKRRRRGGGISDRHCQKTE